MLKIHTRNSGNVAVLCLQGRIVNGETASLREVVRSQHVDTLVLDLGRVSTIDASGLGLMLELRKQALARGVRFKLTNVTRLVKHVLEVTSLDSVFEIAATVEPLPVVSNTRPMPFMPATRCA